MNGEGCMASQRSLNILQDVEEEEEADYEEQPSTSLDGPHRKKRPTRGNGKQESGGKKGGRARIVSMTSSAWGEVCLTNIERIRALRGQVQKGITEHKIFTVMGAYTGLRKALKQRGWLEKKGVPKFQKPRKPSAGSTVSLQSSDSHDTISLQSSCPSTSHADISPGTNDEMLIARLLKNSPPSNFIWTTKDSIEWGNLSKYQLVNRLQKAYFNTKEKQNVFQIGLCGYMRQMHWYCEVGVSDIRFPRCYTIGLNNELEEFQQDFQLTACLNLLKWFVTKYEAGGEEAVLSSTGRIPPRVLDFAITRANDYISQQNHEDIDRSSTSVWCGTWNQFLTSYYLIIHNNCQLRDDKDCPAELVKSCGLYGQAMYQTVKETLADIKRYWPHLDMDGICNVWIVKPGNKSRGRGIKLMNRLKEILQQANPSVPRESRYVVQKYIERPLLIYNTKFDIRQWFLVTCTDPLTVWMYKECYLRFCSQSYSLTNFHEAIHLCNNAIQKKYKNGLRDSNELPKQNMWDSQTFKDYLRKIGHSDVWERRVYPGMKQGIIGTLLAAQEHMGPSDNSFELFGADFILTEDFSTWMIEINSSPDLSHSTSVTARLCPQVLEDIVKVVLDRRENRNASTGNFELAYKQYVPRLPQYCTLSLAVKGRAIVADKRKQTLTQRRSTILSRRRSTVSQFVTKCRIKTFAGPIINNLIDGLADNLDQACEKLEQNKDEEKHTKGSSNEERNIKERKIIKKKPRKKTKNTPRKVSKKVKLQPIVKTNTLPNINSRKQVSNRVTSNKRTIPAVKLFEANNLQSNCQEIKNAKKTETLKSGSHIKPPRTDKGGTTLTTDLKVKTSTKQSEDMARTTSLPANTKTAKLTSQDEINAFMNTYQLLNETKDGCEEVLEKLQGLVESHGLVGKPNETEWTKLLNNNKSVISQIVHQLAQSQPGRDFFVNTSDQREFISRLSNGSTKDKAYKNEPCKSKAVCSNKNQ